APLIVNPEANDRSKGFYINQAIWSDEGRQLCQYVAIEANANIGEFYYNTQKVSQAEIDSLKSWKDLLDPKWKGRIVIGDVATGEAATDRTRLWIAVGQPFIFDDAAAPEWIKARADSQAFLKTLFAELKIVPGK